LLSFWRVKQKCLTLLGGKIGKGVSGG